MPLYMSGYLRWLRFESDSSGWTVSGLISDAFRLHGLYSVQC